MFVRFGGCDYRCSWCDSMYAVDPAQVRENSEKLSVYQIGDKLIALTRSGAGPEPASGLWVTLSGGNPALMRFDTDDVSENSITGHLHGLGYKVAVETQGSIWRDWLERVDHLTVSPKPPSSGMLTPQHAVQTSRFIQRAETRVRQGLRSLKMVVFDDTDLAWARDMVLEHPGWWTFLSVGTDQDALQDEYRVHAGIAERYRWLCESVAGDPAFRRTKVMPQLHVIAWGTRRGV